MPSGKLGHLAKACRNKSSGKSNKGTESWRRETKQPCKRDGKNSEMKKEQPTHLVEETTKEEDVYAEAMYHIRGGNRLNAYEVSIELCNEPCKFEIDTGATRSILSEETYNKLRDKLELRSSKAVLSTYTGEKISVSGEVMVPVKYQDQQYCLNIGHERYINHLLLLLFASHCSKESRPQSTWEGLASGDQA